MSSAKAAGFGNPPGVFSHQSLKNLKSEQFLDCKVNTHLPYTATIKGQIMTKTIDKDTQIFIFPVKTKPLKVMVDPFTSLLFDGTITESK